MGAFMYSRSGDNVAINATVTASAAISDYPVTALVDAVPGFPAKNAATTGWWVLDFGIAQRVDIAAILMHNLTAGLANVHLQANATNSWGAPSMSVAFTIPLARQDGTPTNPFLNLVGQTGYSVSGYRWWRLNFGTANGANISIGDLVLVHQLRTLPYGLAPGVQRGFRRQRVKYQTDGGELLAYDLGASRRTLSGELMFKESSKADIDAWVETSKGDLRPFLIVPDMDVNDAWWVTHVDEEISRTHTVKGMYQMPFKVIEVGAGIPA